MPKQFPNHEIISSQESYRLRFRDYRNDSYIRNNIMNNGVEYTYKVIVGGSGRLSNYGDSD